MTHKLPAYTDSVSKKIDWLIHRSASLEDRLSAIKPFLSGDIENKFTSLIQRISIEESSNKPITQSKLNNQLGALVELEFLEQKVFEENKSVEILLDNRNNISQTDTDLKNPDFRIDNEIYEVKGYSPTNGIKKRDLQKIIQKAGNQIKLSGYETPTKDTAIVDGIKKEIPQGIISLHIKGPNLEINRDEIKRAVFGQCNPNSGRSIKQIDIYHENSLIMQFKQGLDRRMNEVDIKIPTLETEPKIATKIKLDELQDFYNKLNTLKSEDPTKFNSDKTQNTVKKFTAAVQNFFRNEYPDLKLKSMNLQSVEKAIDIMQHNRKEGITLEPEKFRSIGIKQSELNQFIDQGHTIER